MSSDKIILDLCGGTGAWSRPYAEAGYDVRNITLPDYDVCTFIPPEGVHGILAAPPCDHFALSGARWWKKKGISALREGLNVVDACLRIVWRCKRDRKLKWWALENPLGRLNKFLGEPRMKFQPCDYGDPYTKKTQLWGEFTPPMKWQPIVPTEGSKMWRKYGGSKKGKEMRSITPAGFAKAFFEANP